MHASSGSADVADRTWPKSRRSGLELAVVPSAVRIARHWTAHQLAAAGPGGRPADEDLTEAAVLVVSELVTNAIAAVSPPGTLSPPVPGPLALTGRILSFSDLPAAPVMSGPASLPVITAGLPRVCLVITRSAAVVRIEVHDSSAAPLPVPQPSDDDDEDGRGLTVVAALSRRWGWQPTRAGKVVWCELEC